MSFEGAKACKAGIIQPTAILTGQLAGHTSVTNAEPLPPRCKRGGVRICCPFRAQDGVVLIYPRHRLGLMFVMYY